MLSKNIYKEVLEQHLSNQSACFSGYRPKKFKFPLLDGDQNYEKLKSDLKFVINDLIENKINTFYIGLAEGFDIISGEILLECQSEIKEKINIVCVSPFENFIDSFDEDWKFRANNLIKKSDRVKFISPNYKRGIFYKRNRYMVDNSSILICYYDGKSGGTKYTIDYAKAENLNIINIHNNEKYKQLTYF